jgi:hypothetical protein
MATTLQIRREGNLLLPMRPNDSLMMQQLPEGKAFKAKVTKLRSSKANRFYFKVLDLAAFHWPSGLEPEPEGDANLLRAYLQCQAGPEFSWKIDFPVEAYKSVIEMIERTRAKDVFAFVKTIKTDQGDKLRVYIPESTAFDMMEEAVNIKLRRLVFEQIEIVLGKPVEQLVKESEMVA